MGADLASWYDTITSVRDVQNHETLAYRQIWYETLLLAHNRELLELLYLDAPILMKEKPWIAGWLHSQDEFLNDLAKAASVDLGNKLRALPPPDLE